MNLICKLLGHRWIRVWSGGQDAKGAPFMQCVRCHEIGWRAGK